MPRPPPRLYAASGFSRSDSGIGALRGDVKHEATRE